MCLDNVRRQCAQTMCPDNVPIQCAQTMCLDNVTSVEFFSGWDNWKPSSFELLMLMFAIFSLVGRMMMFTLPLSKLVLHLQYMHFVHVLHVLVDLWICGFVDSSTFRAFKFFWNTIFSYGGKWRA